MGIHSCNHCNYTSDRLYNLKVHVRNKHENNKNVTYSSGVPSTIYVGNDDAKALTSIHSPPTQALLKVTMSPQP